MARKLDEWVGKNDDARRPEKVDQRVVERANYRCQECGIRVRSGGEIDHIVALKNWNPTPQAPHGNRESNLRLLCGPCHKLKTRDDVAEKSKVYQVQKRLGPLRREPSRWAQRYAKERADGYNPWTRSKD